MKVLGIDPGLAATGLALVNGTSTQVFGYSFGTITTPPESPLTDRLIHIYDRIREVAEAERPDLMVVEDIFSLGKYPKSGITLGKVTGAILVAGRHGRIPVREVAVREVKKILTGNGAADKNQLERAVRQRLGREEAIRPSHASDAMALALIGLYRGDHYLRNGLDRIS
ncbi:crossover junction endodeoxyribonuclease RuvC [Desulfatibacillum aliphaticivorans]|uniref:Crossover junction endodeoxyribonuclease RuvC n=1 Tax=Desulfatibacillum aliphaticivorans TaxID=218208 RepID=B8FBT6_DESAL|nr:crossover junction endodeoxyribonuclease RuvC [Desulfatibacillum aliphaticivorans]ACL04839.1 Crossover junction endodeoxyribonuclease [Desulfatibacillum aliphaticivorans]